MSVRMSFRVLVVLVGWSCLAATVQAQNSTMFQRTKQALLSEGQKLKRKKIELQLRRDAYNAEVKKLNAWVKQINQMPAGIGRNAAITGYNRKRAELQAKADNLRFDMRRHNDNVADYTRRFNEYIRRVQAAGKATEFRVLQQVQVQWGGRWWNGYVWRAENGRYYVRYTTGYGALEVPREEWVGPSRLRRR